MTTPPVRLPHSRFGLYALPNVARFMPLMIALLSGLLLLAAWYVGQVIVLDHTSVAGVSSSVARTDTALRPDTPLDVTINGTGVELLDARLFRSESSAPDRSVEQTIPVRLEPSADMANWRVATLDGSPLLITDGDYRLIVRASAPRPALPLPRTDVVERQYRFSTVQSPRVEVPAQTQPRWGEPVSVKWSTPMQSVTAVVEPAAPFRTWVDPNDATRSWVQLAPESVADGGTYTVTLNGGRSVDGLGVRHPASFAIAVPPRPHFPEVGVAPLTLRLGESLTLESSTELATADVTSTGDVPITVHHERDQIRVALPEYQQGATVDLVIQSATSTMGAPMAEPLRVRVVTPSALPEPEVLPADGARSVQPATRPSISFAEPVADRDAVVRSLAITPEVAGQWEWTAPDRIEFAPEGRLPTLTDISVTLRGGPDGARSAAGGYLENDISWSFTTTDYKRIDVSLSRQVMTLMEDDVPVRSIVIATGVAGAQTPTGSYEVQYKLPQARFRGVNPSGLRYDIPDVNWVLAFWGDYTIHGAHWRARFGAPASNGCVSMSDPDAKVVYDWADVGTPITIHS